MEKAVGAEVERMCISYCEDEERALRDSDGVANPLKKQQFRKN